MKILDTSLATLEKRHEAKAKNTTNTTQKTKMMSNTGQTKNPGTYAPNIASRYILLSLQIQYIASQVYIHYYDRHKNTVRSNESGNLYGIRHQVRLIIISNQNL